MLKIRLNSYRSCWLKSVLISLIHVCEYRIITLLGKRVICLVLYLEYVFKMSFVAVAFNT